MIRPSKELLVAAYLSQENYTAARYWLLQEHIARQGNAAAWQRLALAMGENDRVAVERILENEDDNLSNFNKMEALRRLDRNEEELALAYSLLTAHKESAATQTYLFNVRDDLIEKTSRQVTGGIEYKTLGNINFVESRAPFQPPYLRGALWAEVKHNLLDSTEPGIILPVRNEVDITAEYKRPWREGIVQANVGGNLREVVCSSWRSQGQPGPYWQSKANFCLAMNEMSHGTGALRALGKKDTILFGLSTHLPQQTFFHVDVDGHRYETRGGSNLGKGYKVK